MDEISQLRLELDTVIRSACSAGRVTRSARQRMLALATRLGKLATAAARAKTSAPDAAEQLQGALDAAAAAGIEPSVIASLRWRGHALRHVIGGEP